MNETPGETAPSPKGIFISRKVLQVIAILLAITALAGSFMIWRANQPTLLLPRNSGLEHANFQPYFYYDQVPAGYSIGNHQNDPEFGITIFSLTKPGKPAVTMTQQRSGNNMDTSELFKEGEAVHDTPYPAVVTEIGSKLVGIMVDTDKHTLILFNTTDDSNKEDIKSLIRNLKPIER